MPTIEYSPSSHATCHGCHHKIQAGTVRVGVKRSSGYDGKHGNFHTEYYHAGCYKLRKDFTKFFGWNSLARKDQRQYGPPLDKKPTLIQQLPEAVEHGSKRWKIVAQVTFKSPLKTYSNSKGQSGIYFHVELIDHSGIDIKAVCFHEAAEKWHPRFVTGQVYEIAHGTLKPTKPQYPSHCLSPMELYLDAESHVMPYDGPIHEGVILAYHFVPLETLLEDEAAADHGTPRFVDVVAVVQHVSTQMEPGGTLSVQLVDDTSLDVVPWSLSLDDKGATATETNTPKVGQVVALHQAKFAQGKLWTVIPQEKVLGTVQHKSPWKAVDLVARSEHAHLFNHVQRLHQWWAKNHHSSPQKQPPTVASATTGPPKATAKSSTSPLSRSTRKTASPFTKASLVPTKLVLTPTKQVTPSPNKASPPRRKTLLQGKDCFRSPTPKRTKRSEPSYEKHF